ncbi:glycoside hydrolase family 15 protein [Streptomyces montanisoli]|uniref:Glycoside hydrolase family 15 protein n=1 Tax=Streptomyces montanisoli TaxID=2798581 RepID=A0A940RW82_9ACTN|nr:glycoside hydrolase family 15 protein [Streptomyces montanisoli]MBP0456848.1 glycoside hydrolase family 15 protein [Streptomyces montanisoli]
MISHRTDGFLPLRGYALLGDLRATALVGTDGSVDWFAAPAMDAPPVCAALLDPGAGGTITLAPTVPCTATRRYLGDTMVLETTWTTERGTARVTDCLSLGALGNLPWTELARVVTVDDGEVPMAWTVRPGHRLVAGSQAWARDEDGTHLVTAGEQHLGVVTEGLGTARPAGHHVEGGAVVRPGAPALLAVMVTEHAPVHLPTPEEIRSRAEHTADTWRQWSAQVGDAGPHKEAVLRSALTLKALTYQPTGAIAGAATTSLPEKIGGELNYDYRYAWIRDGSYALAAMARLGLSEELHAGVSWLLGVAALQAPALRPFYTLDGEAAEPAMRAVTGAPGYRQSPPVHVGNGAADQRQTGSYGDLLDAVLLYTEHDGRLDARTGALVSAMADRVCDLWRTPDAGFWELGEARHYTSSKIGCWVALDRAVRLAEAGRLTSPHVERWRMERSEIRSWIDENCWSAVKQSYTFHAGTDELDAAALLVARTGYCRGDDPRLRSTIEAVRAELGAGGALLYRYSGQQEKEGAFLVCSFWLVEALTHVGSTKEAAELLDELVGRANDVSLYTEQIDAESGELLGNMPQALSHLGLIAAATRLRGGTA